MKLLYLTCIYIHVIYPMHLNYKIKIHFLFCKILLVTNFEKPSYFNSIKKIV